MVEGQVDNPTLKVGLLAIAATMLLLGGAILGARLEGIKVEGMGDLVISLVILGAALLFFRTRAGGKRAADLVATIALFSLISAASGLLSYIAFRSGAPLADARLASWDAALGLSWPAWSGWVAQHLALTHLLHFAYDSMAIQVTAALILLPLCGMRSRSYELLAVFALAMIPTLLLCALLPAEGSGVYFEGYQPAQYLVAQFALRSGTLMTFNIVNIQGIVTFPSFHAVTAVAMINATRRTPLVFLAWVLNILMIISAPTEGWHYFVDVFAGITICLACIALVRRLPRAFAPAI